MKPLRASCSLITALKGDFGIYVCDCLLRLMLMLVALVILILAADIHSLLKLLEPLLQVQIGRTTFLRHMLFALLVHIVPNVTGTA